MTINIEITRNPDFQALAALHRVCFDPAWNAQAFADLLTFSGSVAFIASPDNVPGTVAGFAITRRIFEEIEIITLAVSPVYRRIGTGKAIVGAMLELAQKDGLKSAFLEVREGNMAARRLYEDAGFALLSIRKNYYQNSYGEVENAIVMRKTLQP